MKGDDFGANEVVSSLEVRQGDINLAFVGDELVDRGEAVFVNLDPTLLPVRLGRGDIHQDGALVRLYDCQK